MDGIEQSTFILKMSNVLTLNTGATIPQVGLGLWKSSAESGVSDAVQVALKEG